MPESAFSPLFRYAHDCYRADHRRTTLWDLFHRRVRRRYVFDGAEDVMTGELPHAVVERAWGEETRSAARMYDAESELVMGTLFVTGPLGVNGTEMSLCAPLVLFPAEIVERSRFLFVRPSGEERRVNHLLLQTLAEQCVAPDAVDGVIEDVRDLLGGRDLTPQVVERLSDYLADQLDLNIGAMSSYPNRVGEQALRQHRRETPAGLHRLLPATAAALIPRSRSSRGILHELSELADTPSCSRPVQVLISQSRQNPDGEERTGTASTHADVPAILSAAQHQILDRAQARPLSVAIGPPGTGKSFTIAAIAVEHLSRGKSVLVACKKEHAVNVVADKIERQLGLTGCIVRAGRSEYLRDLKTYLEELLMGVHTANVPSRASLQATKKAVRDAKTDVQRREEKLRSALQQHQAWGNDLAAPTGSFWGRLKERWVTWRVQRTSPSLAAQADDLRRRQEERVRRTREMIRQAYTANLAHLLDEHRDDLKQLLSALRARTSGTRLERMRKLDLSIVLRALPIWLVNMDDVAEILPLAKESFDLAVIDEASQCDVPSALPVLQRARRAVITGDPKQLRHISFLSRDRQQEIHDRHLGQETPARQSPADERPVGAPDAFDYRETSLLDLANDRLGSQRDVSFLDEHYRSVPPIISFSNERFYGGSLRIMTEKPDQALPDALRVIQADGTRDDDGVNRAEVNAIVCDTATLIEAERHEPVPTRIGILSPFRSQVEALRTALRDRLDLGAMDRHDLRVGTAHAFQGEERDAMLVSWCVDGHGRGGARRFAERPDVFNVSITRARNRQWSYVSVHPSMLPPEGLLGAYLRSVDADSGPEPRSESEAHDRFAAAVREALERSGLSVWTGVTMAGWTMDLVVRTRTGYAGIDLVGYPGRFDAPIPLERYRMLGRAGLTVLPLSFARWTTDSSTALQPLLDVLLDSK